MRENEIGRKKWELREKTYLPQNSDSPYRRPIITWSLHSCCLISLLAPRSCCSHHSILPPTPRSRRSISSATESHPSHHSILPTTPRSRPSHRSSRQPHLYLVIVPLFTIFLSLQFSHKTNIKENLISLVCSFLFSILFFPLLSLLVKPNTTLDNNHLFEGKLLCDASWIRFIYFLKLKCRLEQEYLPFVGQQNTFISTFSWIILVGYMFSSVFPYTSKHYVFYWFRADVDYWVSANWLLPFWSSVINICISSFR